MSRGDSRADSSDNESNRICGACIGEEYLRSHVNSAGEKARCSYCGERANTISIGELADLVEHAIEDHFYQTSTEPDGIEYAMLKDPESSYQWERKGYPIANVIADAASIEEEPAEHVREVLEERHYDFEEAASGGECPFDEDAHYAERGPGEDYELQAGWSYLEASLKTEMRLFNRVAEATLDSVFENLAEHRTRDGRTVLIEAGPGTELSSFFRARVFQSDGRLKSALRRPDRGLGPPPPEEATAGRMNARGISVFYGATDEATAIAEVRPPVGSRVATARFNVMRPLRLLDVEALRSIYVEGSVFDSTYAPRLKKAGFLEQLSHRIVIPVMPEDEPADYLITQAIADYLAGRNEPPIDGIVFPTVQSNGHGINVVLFHKSSRVKPLTFPKGTDIDVWLTRSTEEGPEPDYVVIEQTPPKEENDEGEDKSLALMFLPSRRSAEGEDVREPALEILLDSVQIHHVQGVTFSTGSYPVSRVRSEKSEPKF